MSITPSEAAEEQALEELYAEFRDEAIEEFTSERLQSFYLANPAIAHSPKWALAESRLLLPDHPAAALVFGAVAIEVGLKLLMLKPVVFGLVHSESAASLIIDYAIGRNSIDRFQKLLFHIIKQYGGVDLSDFKRPDAAKTLWEETTLVRKKRNDVVHKADTATIDEATHSVEVASAVIESLFPSVLDRLGLCLDDNDRICDKSKYELSKLLESMKTREKA